ncbi:relaxin receptor 1-like [Panonychus citri]|uniref:relaxin receptor 1-like n=1 Tax=Panonychus citri TaxID=50023 RepID=UPI002307AE92|nr:relaxin receptor 1-like [Panonychus citri]
MMTLNQICTILSLVAIFATVFLLPLLLLFGEDVAKIERQYSEYNFDPFSDSSDSPESTVNHNNSHETLSSPSSSSKKSNESTTLACANIYDFPCYQSFDEDNQVICLNRDYQCNKIADCPNGEDEEECHDLYGALDQHFANQADKMKYLNVTIKSQPQFIHNNCTLSDIYQSVCPCILNDSTRILCPNHNFNQIPDNLSLTITVLNLDNGSIEAIDSDILSKYQNLTTLSLKNNQLTTIESTTFENLIHLKRLYLIGNQINHIDENAFHKLTNLKFLELHTNRLETIDAALLFKGLSKLETLYLEFNQLRSIGIFPHLNSLRWIDLSNNQLTEIQSIFQNLDHLEILNLSSNKLKRLPADAFHFNKRLIHLEVPLNQIDSIDVTTFHNLRDLRKLNLSYNPLTTLPRHVFKESRELQSIDLTGIEIRNIHPDHFNRTFNLRHVYFSKFRYCMYAPRVRVCRPFSDGVSSVKHLLLYPILRMFVWIVAGITCAGNTLVLVWRSLAKKEHQSLSLLVKNLAIADLMMGLYLVVIGSYDQAFREKYNNYALQWMHSWKCNFCGFLATLSSELSIFIVLMITIERYRSITMTCRLVTLRWTATILLIIWIISLAISVFPILYWSDPEDPLYYASNGVCFPLHLEDPFMFGWQFSTFIFLGINLPVIVIIIGLYTRLFLIIKRDRRLTRPALLGKDEHEDVILAFRFFCIVVTDCLCWVPIVSIKIVSFTYIYISPKVYAWLVVFILPINSALNPMIYTIAAPTGFRRKANKYIRQARRYLGPMIGYKNSNSDRGCRDHYSSSVPSNGTNSSLDHTRSSNCSVLSMAAVNSLTTKTNGIINTNGLTNEKELNKMNNKSTK